MAKRKSSHATPESAATVPSAPPVPAPLLECERLLQAGNLAGARRSARAELAANPVGETAARALAVRQQTDLDGPPFLVFGGMLVVLAVVFAVAITSRNTQLAELAAALNVPATIPAGAQAVTPPPADAHPQDGKEPHDPPR